ncbi:MAG: hypothetical protein ABIF10_00325 [Candidatus Woesearchaeota archaeon]
MLPTTRSPGNGLSVDSKDRVLSIVRNHGPVTPIQVARELKVESYMASAVLSELLGEKKIMMSSLRVGTSPIYFVRVQQDKLQEYIKYLNEKDRRTCAALKEAKILQDSSLDPLTRVSLRQIKDFAIPLEVEHEGRKEIFWKWYLLTPEEAEELVRSKMGIGKHDGAQASLEQKKEPEQKEPERRKRKVEKPNGFSEVAAFFQKNGIVIMQELITRKDKDYIIKVPSAVGELAYFCAVKFKQRINEGDLAAAYMKAETRKLPVLFLTSGELTKHAKEIASSKNIAVRKV